MAYLVFMKTNIASSPRAHTAERGGEFLQDWILLGFTGVGDHEKPILLNNHAIGDDRLSVFSGTRSEAYCEADS